MPDYGHELPVSNRKPRVLTERLWETPEVGREPDGELIELIDADPGAFGVPRHTTTQPPDRERTPVPWKGVLIGLAAVVVLAGVVSGVMAWAPWEPDPRMVLDDQRDYPTELSSHLVFGRPATPRDGASETGPGADVKWQDGRPGYFFAEPGATFQTADGTAAWFGFVAVPAKDGPKIDGTRTIAGAPAQVSDRGEFAELALSWGPIDGWVFSALTVQMKVEDAVALAEQLRMVDGHPVVRDRAALKTLQPLGPMGAYQALMAIQSAGVDSTSSFEHTAAVFYGDGRQSVVSTPAPDNTLAMVQFMFHEKGKKGSVHGHDALGLVHSAGPFGDPDRSTVMWWEGGRLVAVTGGSDLSHTFELAESVRPATTGEWPEK